MGIVSKLFRAYGLYNFESVSITVTVLRFQSSFELMGYITGTIHVPTEVAITFQSSFELMGYITLAAFDSTSLNRYVSKLFRAYGLYNIILRNMKVKKLTRFKALSSLWVI